MNRTTASLAAVASALLLGSAGIVGAQQAYSGPDLTEVQARGQQVCLPRDRVAGHLVNKYGEQPRGIGTSGQAGLVEIWTSGDSGSWTLLLTRPDGISCVIGTGEDWQDHPKSASYIAPEESPI